MIRAIGFDDEGIARARKLGAEKLRRAPAAVGYDAEADVLIVTMPNHVKVSIPRKGISAIRSVPKVVVKTIALGIDHRSFDIEERDIHISAFGLLRHAVLGEDPYSRAGSVTSPAKKRAARRNGAKGGRPRNRARH